MARVTSDICRVRRVPIEPVIVLYVTALLLHLPTYQHYLYHRAQKTLRINETSYNVDNCDKNLTATTNKIQKEASRYILAVSLASTFPSIFVSLVYGPLSDRKGRKLTMLLAMAGNILDFTVILVTIKFELPVYIIVIGSAIGSLGGGYTTFVFAVAAYIADTTKTQAKLPVRMAVLEAMALIGGVVAQATSGLWIEYLGYAAPYWFIFGSNITAFLYTAFLLPESWRNTEAQYQSCRQNCCSDLKTLQSVVGTKRENNGRFELICLLVINTLLLLPNSVINQLVILYSKDQPLCWTPNFIGYYLASTFLARAIGAVVFMKLFKSIFNLQNYTIMQISSICLTGLLVMIGLSTTILKMFLTTIPFLFVGLSQPCIRTLTSSIVKPSEQGSLFCISASMESVGNFLASTVFNPVYQKSLSFSWPHGNGLIFFLNAGVTAIAFIFISCLKSSVKKNGNRYEIIADNHNTGPCNCGRNVASESVDE